MNPGNLNQDRILPGRTPKRLEKLAACTVAHMLVRRCLPALIQYWGIDYKQWDSEVYIERADDDMADEDGSDDERSKSSNSSEMSQTRKKIKIAPQIHQAPTSQGKIQQNVTCPGRGKHWCPNIFCSCHVDTADQAEMIVAEEPLLQQELKGATHVTNEACPNPVDNRQNELSRQIEVAVSLVQKGMAALIPGIIPGIDDDESETEGSSSSDSHLPRRPNSTDSSGSGRARSPDDDVPTSQEPEQIEYLNRTENLWVQILSYRYLLQHLKKVKRWFDRVVTFGNGGFALHWLMSEGLIEVLDCFVSPKVCTPFFRFTLQVMFSQEAGSMGQKNQDKVPGVKLCRAYANFLKRFKPFGLRKLCTASMFFAHPAPISVIMKNSKYLKKLVVNVDACKPILKCARKHCKDIKEIALLTNNPFDEVLFTESFLFLVFFNGMSFYELLQYTDRKSDILLSFPKLERFRLFFIGTAFYMFIFCLQHFYPKIKTEFLYGLAEENLTPSLLRSKLQIPIFHESNSSYYWDSVVFLQVQTRFQSEVNEEIHQWPKVKSVSLWNHFVSDVPNTLVEEIVTKYGCTNIVFRMPLVYLDNEEKVFSPHVTPVGERLTELTISAGRTAFHASELVAGLNACPNLRLFGLEVACFLPVTGEEIVALKHFPELKFLSVTINGLLDPEIDYVEESLHLARLLGNLILKAPSLSILELLKTPGQSLINILNEIENRTNLDTLVIDCSFVMDLVHRLGVVVDSLPKLSYLMLYRATTDLYVETKKIFHGSELQVAYRCAKLVGIEDYE